MDTFIKLAMSEDTSIEHLRKLVEGRSGKRESFDATNNWDTPPAIMFSKPISQTMDTKVRESTKEFPGKQGSSF